MYEDKTKDIGYCMKALRSLSDKEIVNHSEYILRKMEVFYTTLYETANSTVVNDIRGALCRIDEAMFKEKII